MSYACIWWRGRGFEPARRLVTDSPVFDTGALPLRLPLQICWSRWRELNSLPVAYGATALPKRATPAWRRRSELHRRLKLLQSRALLLGYVVMVRDRRFELRIPRVRTETIPASVCRAWLRDFDSNEDDEVQPLAAYHWLISEYER